MGKTILIFIFGFISLPILAQTSVDTVRKMDDNIQTKMKYGNLIVQTIPSRVDIVIPKLGVDEEKKQDSLIFEEVYTGLYELSLKSEKENFKCFVEVSDNETVHAVVNLNEKSLKTNIIEYTLSTEVEEEIDTEQLYVMVENMPEFPGGARGLRDWIKSNVKYPEIARRNKVTGRVYVGFVIDQEGKVGKVKILRSINSVLDKEALRVISNMPIWKPGMQKGKPVKVSYTFPINFQLHR